MVSEELLLQIKYACFNIFCQVAKKIAYLHGKAEINILLAGAHSPGGYLNMVKLKMAGLGSLLFQVKQVPSSGSYLT